MDIPPVLSAKYSRTFAYDTVKDRIPQILTKVIDVCHRHIPKSLADNGEDGKTDSIEVVGKLSKLRNEIMTDKVISLLHDSLLDAEIWNARLKEYRETSGENPSWFTASWLYVECFLYRKIANILKNSKYMQQFDPFMEQKKRSLHQSIDAIHNLATHLCNIHQTLDRSNANELESNFLDLLQVSLWGNKCDLSISGGDENAQISPGIHKNLKLFRSAILVNDSDEVWRHLEVGTKSQHEVRVDIVLDNSGFELYSDLVLADFLLTSGICTQVVFHPKLIPWFVSDVTPLDFKSTIAYLSSCEGAVGDLAKSWDSYLSSQQMVLIEDEDLLEFWSLPDPYYKMQAVCPKLYDYISLSHLIIFKGDLNYRKLVGDHDWPHETVFKKALRGFAPSNLCSLRTLKADVVVGLKPGVADCVANEDNDWMTTGKYAVIQFSC